jgi:hypothetical protein
MNARGHADGHQPVDESLADGLQWLCDLVHPTFAM